MTSAVAKTWEFRCPGLEAVMPAEINEKKALKIRFATMVYMNKALSKSGEKEGIFLSLELENGKCSIYFSATREGASHHDLLDLLTKAVQSDVSINAVQIDSHSFDRLELTIPLALRMRAGLA